MREYGLAEVADILSLPSEAMVGIDYDDDRVHDGGGRNEYWFDSADGETYGIHSAWKEARKSVRRGHASPEKICVRLTCGSRGINGYAYI